LGRLGTYRYLDMDVTIHEALAAVTAMLKALDDGTDIPPFFTDPLGGAKH
jgi:UDP-galactopyranose mutase